MKLTLTQDELYAVQRALAGRNGGVAQKVATARPEVPFSVTWDELGECLNALESRE